MLFVGGPSCFYGYYSQFILFASRSYEQICENANFTQRYIWRTIKKAIPLQKEPTMYRLLMRLCLTLLLLLSTLSPSLAQQSSDTGLLLNELCAANIDMHLDPSYNYGAWVELYNPTSQVVTLNKLQLRHTDSKGVAQQHKLGYAHGNVPAMGFAVLWFDHNSTDGFFGPNAGTQIPFKLDAEGGIVELLDAEGGTLDKVEYPAAIARSSYFRSSDAAPAWEWTATPTPGSTNNLCPIAHGRAEAPVPSTEGGVFANSFSLSIDVPEGAALYYTTDGSTPVPGVSPRSQDGWFRADTTTLLRLVLAREGMLNSPVVTRSFIKAEQDYYLPILSVSTRPAHLYDDSIGIYVRGKNGRTANNSGTKANINMDWERPVNVEYFVKDGEGRYAQYVNQEAAMAIFGGWTRFNTGFTDGWVYKPSFKLKSGKVFEGENSFAYSLFDSKPFVKIKNFLVRNGGQDKFYRMKDALCQELIRTSGIYVDCQAYQPSHVFLNGRYLGMLNLREESNKQFAFSNYGIDTDAMDQWEGEGVMKAGDRAKLDEWYSLSVRLAANPADTAVWRQICELVDIDEFCNYMAAEIYMGNQDWLRGGLKNIKGFRARDDGGRFHIVIHDLDGCFGDTDMLQQLLKKGTGSMPKRFCNMLKYEPFRKQFIDAFCLMNGSVFDPLRCKPLLTAMAERVAGALLLEGMDAMEKAEDIYSRIADEEVRRPALKQSLVQAFALDGEYDVRLGSSIPGARLLLNGQEVPGGRFDGYLFSPVTLTSLAPDGYSFAGWQVDGEVVCTDPVFCLSEEQVAGSYEVTACYTADDAGTCPPIRINEVSAANDIYVNDLGKKTDWVELYNTTDNDLDLSGIYISDNIGKKQKYQIPADGADVTIPAHGYRIVWCDGKASAAQLHAPFKLENADSAFVCITAEDGSWTDSLCYMAQPRWRTYGRYPDGGSSVALFDRPTIGNANSIGTGTALRNQASVQDGTGIRGTSSGRQVADIAYYNLKGQRIADIEREHIVIQRIRYSDGSITSRKVVVVR